jgi:Ras-related protein Rab-39B
LFTFTFRSITKSYYRNSVGVLIVYDITKRSSFDHLEDWLAEAKFYIEPHKAVYLIVGHKCDMEEQRAVTAKEGRQFARKHGLEYLETSAITGQNVEESFSCVAREVYRLMERGEIQIQEGWDGIKNGYSRPRESFQLEEGEPESGGCC